MSGPHYACSQCDNLIAVHYGRELFTPATILQLDWSPPLIQRGEQLGPFRWTISATKKDDLVARMLWLEAKLEDDGFRFNALHRRMLFFDESGFLGYLFWSETRHEETGKKEPVLRQIFVKKEFRKKGIATAAIQLWAERFAFPLAAKFGVESPENDTIRILARLGYVERDDKNKFIATKCYWFM